MAFQLIARQLNCCCGTVVVVVVVSRPVTVSTVTVSVTASAINVLTV